MLHFAVDRIIHKYRKTVLTSIFMRMIGIARTKRTKRVLIRVAKGYSQGMKLSA